MEEFVDKYFLRSRDILLRDGISPYVRMQVFQRPGGPADQIEEALEILETHSRLRENDGHVFAVREGSQVEAEESLLLIEGPITEFVALETLYLGVLSERRADPDLAYRGARAIVEAAEDVPVFYFGARHFPWWMDGVLSEVCHRAGMKGCSTDRGSRHWGGAGMGTTPHVLILSYAAAGSVHPTADAARAFDRYVDRSVPRTILIDTFNREIDDALGAAGALGDRMAGVRIDTCWENVAQGADAQRPPAIGVDPRYLQGGGVTIPAVWALRRALDEGGFPETTLFVSSGFDAAKTAAFMKARKVYRDLHGKALFDGIGTGSLLPGGRMATADMVQYRRDGRWIDCAKAGRRYRPNPALRRVW